MKVRASDIIFTLFMMLAVTVFLFVDSFNGDRGGMKKETEPSYSMSSTEAENVQLQEEEEDDSLSGLPGAKEYTSADGTKYYFVTDGMTGDTYVYRSRDVSWDIDPEDPANWKKIATYPEGEMVNPEDFDF